ncbi:MAG: oxidoreductase, partial [Pseudomonadota bacterium]
MTFGLQNRSFVITGAASGIGRAIARQAAFSGAEMLFLTDLCTPGLAETAIMIGVGTRVKTHVADLSDPMTPKEVCASARAAFGRIDGLVNAAGITDRASILDGSAEIWDRLFAINARAPFLLMKEVIADLLGRGAPGSIVNIQSMNAHCGAPDLAIYSATKGALQTLTKNAANAYLSDRIRVNGINLGWTKTEAEHRMQSQTLGQGEDWAERVGAQMPLGHL